MQSCIVMLRVLSMDLVIFFGRSKTIVNFIQFDFVVNVQHQQKSNITYTILTKKISCLLRRIISDCSFKLTNKRKGSQSYF